MNLRPLVPLAACLAGPAEAADPQPSEPYSQVVHGQLRMGPAEDGRTALAYLVLNEVPNAHFHATLLEAARVGGPNLINNGTVWFKLGCWRGDQALSSIENGRPVVDGFSRLHEASPSHLAVVRLDFNTGNEPSTGMCSSLADHAEVTGFIDKAR